MEEKERIPRLQYTVTLNKIEMPGRGVGVRWVMSALPVALKLRRGMGAFPFVHPTPVYTVQQAITALLQEETKIIRLSWRLFLAPTLHRIQAQNGRTEYWVVSLGHNGI
jgi:hypothetical protein